MKNEDYYLLLQEELSIKDNTLHNYKVPLSQYVEYNNLSLHELLKEAKHEQVTRPWMDERTIKKRLYGYRRELKNKGLQHSSINIMISRVKTFYNLYEIDLPRMKRLKVLDNETFHDIPTMDHIREIVNGSGNLKHKALILFMVSSGTGTKEALGLTIQDFIKATSSYHHDINITDVLNSLKNDKDIIPTWAFRRVKTNYQYYTFSSPESTTAIINFLLKRKNLKHTDSLFHLSQTGVKHVFERNNTKYEFGKKRTNRNFLHAHALRKTFATTLTKARLDNLIIEWLLGHSIPSTRASYFKSDPSFLKEEYMKVVNHLSIKEIVIRDRTSKEIKQIVLENEAKDKRLLDLEERDKMREAQLNRVLSELNLEK